MEGNMAKNMRTLLLESFTQLTWIGLILRDTKHQGQYSQFGRITALQGRKWWCQNANIERCSWGHGALCVWWRLEYGPGSVWMAGSMFFLQNDDMGEMNIYAILTKFSTKLSSYALILSLIIQIRKMQLVALGHHLSVSVQLWCPGIPWPWWLHH